jgi:hypothetical protein
METQLIKKKKIIKLSTTLVNSDTYQRTNYLKNEIQILVSILLKKKLKKSWSHLNSIHPDV